MSTERDNGVRAIGRGLAVLRVINQHVSLDMTSIARATNLPYPTACRIVETLIDEGMIERELGRKVYRTTALVQTLSHGYRPEDELAVAAEDLICDVTKSILWPLAVCSRVGTSMMIRTTSHRISPNTLNTYYPGYTLPILGTSAGIVYLSFCNDSERETVLEGLVEAKELGTYGRRSLARRFAETRHNGLAQTDRCQRTANPGKTSSIAAPVMVRGECVAAVTLTVYASVMSAAEAAQRYGEVTCDAARTIGERLLSRTNVSVQGDHRPACCR